MTAQPIFFTLIATIAGFAHQNNLDEDDRSALSASTVSVFDDERKDELGGLGASKQVDQQASGHDPHTGEQDRNAPHKSVPWTAMSVSAGGDVQAERSAAQHADPEQERQKPEQEVLGHWMEVQVPERGPLYVNTDTLKAQWDHPGVVFEENDRSMDTKAASAAMGEVHEGSDEHTASFAQIVEQENKMDPYAMQSKAASSDLALRLAAARVFEDDDPPPAPKQPATYRERRPSSKAPVPSHKVAPATHRPGSGWSAGKEERAALNWAERNGGAANMADSLTKKNTQGASYSHRGWDGAKAPGPTFRAMTGTGDPSHQVHKNPTRVFVKEDPRRAGTYEGNTVSASKGIDSNTRYNLQPMSSASRFGGAQMRP